MAETAPEHTHDERGPREPHALALGAITILAMLGILALAWLALPRTLLVTAEPADARISVEGGPSAIGTLRVPTDSRAPVNVTVARAGFATQTVDVAPTSLTGPGGRRVSLRAELQRLRVTAGPGDPIVSVFAADGTRVLVGRRRASGSLPSGSYTVVAEAEGAATAHRRIVLDRPARIALTTDPAGQRSATLGMAEAPSRITRLAFSPDGSLLSATLFDGPPDRQLLTVPALEALPDAATNQIRMTGFSSGQVGTSTVDPESKVRYGIDATASAVIAQPPKGRARQLAKLPSRPLVLALASGGRRLVVGSAGGRDRNGAPIPALVVIDTKAGRVIDRITAPTVTALAVSPDGRWIAVADTMQGRVRLLELP